VAKLNKAQALAGTLEAAMALRDEIAFFQAVRVSLIKLTRSGETRSRVEKEAALRQLVAKGVLVEGVNDIFGTLGIGKPRSSTRSSCRRFRPCRPRTWRPSCWSA
jgi:type I restriction enzyme R subunit